MKSKWMLKCTSSNVKALAQGIGVNETIINVLINRGIKTSRDIKKFVDASLEDLYNPFFMIDMDKGVDIIKEAIDMKRKIAIYGDYDADGVTSTVILYKALKRLGGNFIYHIPDREAEGYGMNLDRIRHLKEEGVEIILSCDNGISAIDQIAYAKELGIKVVVTDHHELTFKEEDGERNYILPSADAVINPKRLDCTYPFKLLCGAGIAFKFVQALYSVFNIPETEVLEFLEYAAIGTICDVVDLVDENRIIAKNGLRLIRDTKNMGLNAIIEETSINKDTINSYHIGFIIGPCINATGRLETAKLSVELLLTEDEEAAKDLAAKLHKLNMERQEMTIKSVEEIESIVENSSLKNDKVLVVYKENVHESIAGIAAGRIREKYNLPTIILTKGKDMPKGSGRSIENYNMFEELLKCKELLDKFGGHPMAAGLSLKEENIELLRRKLNENCILTKEDLIPKISIDRKMKLSEVCVSLIKELSVLEPFGKGNASPIFAEKNVDIYKINFIGKDKNTLKFSLKIDGSYNKIDALCFGKGDEFKEYIKQYFNDDYLDIIDNPKNLKMDFIFYPSLNDYNGYITPQLRIVDYRISGK